MLSLSSWRAFRNVLGSLLNVSWRLMPVYSSSNMAISSAILLDLFALELPHLPSTTFPFVPSHQRAIPPFFRSIKRFGTNWTCMARTVFSSAQKCWRFGHRSRAWSYIAGPSNWLSTFIARKTTLSLKRCLCNTFEAARCSSWSKLLSQPPRPSGDQASMDVNGLEPVLLNQKSIIATFPSTRSRRCTLFPLSKCLRMTFGTSPFQFLSLVKRFCMFLLFFVRRSDALAELGAGRLQRASVWRGSCDREAERPLAELNCLMFSFVELFL